MSDGSALPSASLDVRLQRIRGTLEPEALGARGLERVARNPGCQRLRALTIAGVTPRTVAETVLHQKDIEEGQSPLAIATGVSFERDLCEAGATKLLALYREAGRLGDAECKVDIVPEIAPATGKSAGASMARRISHTYRLLRLKLAGKANAPNIIIKPRLIVELLGTEYQVEPDALVASDADRFYRPVEIKSYLDLNGKTSTSDLRAACRQAAVGVIAMRTAVRHVNSMLNGTELIPAIGDLVLRRPGGFRARLRPMDLEGEVDSLQRSLIQAPRDLGELEDLLQSMGDTSVPRRLPTLDSEEVIRAIPASYRSSCREHCDLARVCKKEALAESSPCALGDRVREDLAGTDTMARALELMRGATPRNPDERALADRLMAGRRGLENGLREAM